jgi:excisionase family DNA binding protein
MRQVTGKALAGAWGAAMEQNVLREDEILTSEEARRLLKIGRTKLWDLTKRSLIPAYRVGEGRTSGLRYKRSELLRWLDQHRI